MRVIWTRYCMIFSVFVSMILGGCAYVGQTMSPSPEFSFLVSTDGSLSRTIDNDFACMGLSADDFESVLTPGHYVVSIPYDMSACYLGPSGSDGVTVTRKFGMVGGYRAGVPDPPWMREYWEPSFVYQFPASMGWGGVLWTKPIDGWTTGNIYPPMPAEPNSCSQRMCLGQTGSDPCRSTSWCASVWAVLCADDEHCLAVNLDPGQMFCFRADDDGKRDPIAIATTLLETAWRNLSVERPDLVPWKVPDTNPSPYVPTPISPP